ncbi:DUF7410 domain-containing protein [Natronorubrum sp. FCH18a]|uniref:DUF7410 domain-containing protein n=1 Tax=Natronorubrum sp. FCH18a TaxID=3447018 RepID=UPI003F515322
MSPSDASRATTDPESSDSDRDGDDPGTTLRDAGPETAVRGDEPAARCPYCHQPFHEARFETLHRGLEHPSELSDRERAAFERAYADEGADIRRFRLQALGALLLVYFCLLFLYAVVI